MSNTINNYAGVGEKFNLTTDKFDVALGTGIGVDSNNNLTLQIAGTGLGGVKNGGNVVVNTDGTMTAPAGSGGTAGVTSFQTRTGAVTLTQADITSAVAAAALSAPQQASALGLGSAAGVASSSFDTAGAGTTAANAVNRLGGPPTTGQAIRAYDEVVVNGRKYYAPAAFTAGTFAADLANGLWVTTGLVIGTTTGTAADGGLLATAQAAIAANTAAITSLQQPLSRRIAAGSTTDTPAQTDNQKTVGGLNTATATVTAPVLADGTVVNYMQQAAGQIVVAAGTGVTLKSDKATASFTTARQGAIISLVWQSTGPGTAIVYVLGNTQ